MKKRRVRSVSKNKNIKIILVALVTLIIGFILLEYVARLEKPFLGATFHIIFGCVLIAVSSIVLFLTIKKQFFRKRRSQSKYTYLNKDNNDNEKQ
ncbi:MAG TPA: hypothetical protein VN192_06125 [Flavobacterium sp.]|jgi:uncharacterized membrane protein|nr:hypothetical protein [Flavobacterium sp.]